MDYFLGTLYQGIVGIVPSLVSPIAFLIATRKQSLLHRLFFSAPGLLVVGLFVVAAAISGFAPIETTWRIIWQVYQGLLFVSLAMIVPVVVLFKGSKWLHLFHLFTLVGAALLWFLGGQSISHDWI